MPSGFATFLTSLDRDIGSDGTVVYQRLAIERNELVARRSAAWAGKPSSALEPSEFLETSVARASSWIRNLWIWCRYLLNRLSIALRSAG
jgi:hypothetical protein